MKRLYFCSATVDEFGLVSYNTRTVSISGNSVSLHMIHTNTTMSHVRKYARYLKEHGQEDMSNIVLALYHLAIAEHVTDTIYDPLTGEISVVK